MGTILKRYILPHPPIILPEVGGANRHVAYKTCDSMNAIAREIAGLNPTTIIILTPHAAPFSDGFSITDSFFISGDFEEFGSSFSMEKDIDKTFVNKLKLKCFSERLPLITLDQSNCEMYEINYKLDHGSMVPLYFIDKHLKHYKIVTISHGGLSRLHHYKLGMFIEDTIESLTGDYVIISSGDLSHKLLEDSPYGYHPSGEKFDNSTLNLMKNNNLEELLFLDDSLCEDSCQCALKPLYMLLGTLNKSSYECDVLSYEHPFGVGYCVCGIKSTHICETKLEEINSRFERRLSDMKSNESQYVALARDSIENFVKHKIYTQAPSSLSKDLLFDKKGVFVSIKRDGDLRGCIGTILPTCERTCDEIIKNAIESCSHDPRFSPITEDELPFLNISVDVLEEGESCSKDELDPYKYGIIVSHEDKHGVLLPNLQEVDSVDSQLSIALSKAGISEDEPYDLERFEVTRYS